MEQCGASKRIGAFARASALILAVFAIDAESSCAGAPAPAGDSSASFRPFDTIACDLRDLFTDAWDVVTLPVTRFDRDDWLWTAGGAAAVGTGFGLDEPVRETALDVQGSDGNAIADLGNEFGRNRSGLIVATAIYLPGLLLNKSGVRRTGRHLFQTLLYSAAVNSLLKHTLGRHRPVQEDGPGAFSGPWQTDDRYLSFTSGHTTVAFSIASSLSADIGIPWVTVGLYTGASLTGLSRIYADRHWVSDVLGAALTTTAIGIGVVQLDRTDSNPDTDYGWRIAPSLHGISIVYSM